MSFCFLFIQVGVTVSPSPHPHPTPSHSLISSPLTHSSLPLPPFLSTYLSLSHGYTLLDDREMAARVLEDSIANLTVFLCEFRIFGKDGNIKHVSSRGTVLLDAHKKPVRIMGICMDITSLRMDAQARLQR
jgi:hypothetical protein